MPLLVFLTSFSHRFRRSRQASKAPDDPGTGRAEVPLSLHNLRGFSKMERMQVIMLLICIFQSTAPACIINLW